MTLKGDVLLGVVEEAEDAAKALSEALLGSLGGEESITWLEALTILDALRKTVTSLLQSDAGLVRYLYLTAPHGDTEVEGIGVVGIRRSNDRNAWDHDGWKHDVRAALLEEYGYGDGLVDVQSGEMVDVLDLLTALQDVHGASAPKVTKLRALGLDPAAYCEEVPGKPSVTITRPGG